MKRILIFSTAYFPFVGGAEVAIKEIVDSLKDFEFDMITALMDSKLPRQEKIGNITVHRIGMGLPMIDKYYLAFCGHRKAAALHRQKNYDLTWSMMASYGGFAGMFFKNRNPRTPFLLTLQEGDPFEYIMKRVGFLKKWFVKIFQKADYIQCISNYLADWARTMGTQAPIIVVPNGVDVQKFTRNFPEDELLRIKKELGKNETDKFVIHSGRLVRKNGLRYVIQALPQLPSNVKFFIMGDGEDRIECEQIVKELNLEKRVIFFGKYDNDILPPYLKVSDIFIRPSLSEGQGISFLEAMAAGLPVIATPVGGIPDFLADNETGWFCREEDPDSIAQKIKYILDEKNKEDVKRVTRQARHMIDKSYQWETIRERMKSIFIQMTARNGS